MGDMTLGLHGGIGLPGGQAYLGDRPTWGTGLPGGQAYQGAGLPGGTGLPGRKGLPRGQAYQGDRLNRGTGLPGGQTNQGERPGKGMGKAYQGKDLKGKLLTYNRRAEYSIAVTDLMKKIYPTPQIGAETPAGE